MVYFGQSRCKPSLASFLVTPTKNAKYHAITSESSLRVVALTRHSAKAYMLSDRELVQDKKPSILEFKPYRYSAIRDGHNVRDTYRLTGTVPVVDSLDHFQGRGFTIKCTRVKLN